MILLCRALGKIQKSFVPSLSETFFALLSDMEHPEYECPKSYEILTPKRLDSVFRSLDAQYIMFLGYRS